MSRLASHLEYSAYSNLLTFTLFLLALPLQAQPANHAVYQRFEGTVGGQPVIMHLAPTGNVKRGVYYYTKVGQTIPLWSGYYGEHPTDPPDSVILEEQAYGDTSSVQNHLRMRYTSPTELSGLWISGDGKRSLPLILHASYPPGSLHLNAITIIDSLVKKERRNGSISATFSANIVLPDGDDFTASHFITSRIAEYVGCKDHASSVPDCIRENMRDYLSGTISELDSEIVDLPDSEMGEDWSARFQYFDDLSISVRYNDNGLLMLNDEGSAYTGGAHESFGIQVHAFDVAGQRELKLSDITTADSAMLGRILVKYFREQYHLQKSQPLTDILFDDFLPANSNFYLTDRGLGFVYSPYEVASWAQGVVEVFIPFSALRGKLTPWVMKRLKL